jgi:hypothetical protein
MAVFCAKAVGASPQGNAAAARARIRAALTLPVVKVMV